MRALITGGAGFIGYHLSLMMASAGHDVIVCDNLFRGVMDEDLTSLLQHSRVSFQELDLSDRASLQSLPRDVDVVFHLAAINGTRHFYEMPYTVLRENLLATINVLDWIQDSDCRRLIWPSSSEVYAGSVETGSAPIPTPEAVPLTISDVTNPRFSYAGSKIAGELLSWHFAKSKGCAVTIVRPHNIYGPRMGYEHVIPQFIVRILERRDPFPMYGGEQTRAFCYVDDFVRGMLLAAEVFSDEQVRIVNIGNEHEVNIGEMATELFSLAGFHPVVDMRPSPAGSVSRRCPDIRLAREILGYNPRVDLKDGLERTYEWYSAHHTPQTPPMGY